MKRHAIPITMSVLTLAIILLPGSVFAQDTRGVTGAGKATLPAGASLSGVSVSGLQFGLGAVIPGDGTAAGSLQATLAGKTLLGLPQTIELTGNATNGAINADGSQTFSGTGTLDMGDGTAPLTNVPFAVTASATSLLLSIGATNLPAAAINAGTVQIQ